MRFSLFVFVICSITACSNRESVISDIQKIKSRKIAFPTLYNAQNSNINNENKRPINLVIYYDSLECSHCRISHLVDMKDIVEISHLYEQFDVLFIFAPAKKDMRHLWLSVKKHEYENKIYIDSTCNFLKYNPHIPSKSQYHSFLLDRNNDVVLVGNPLASDAMWDLFRKTLDNMLAHDGVYVPDK